VGIDWLAQVSTRTAAGRGFPGPSGRADAENGPDLSDISTLSIAPIAPLRRIELILKLATAGLPVIKATGRLDEQDLQDGFGLSQACAMHSFQLDPVSSPSRHPVHPVEKLRLQYYDWNEVTKNLRDMRVKPIPR
jgi:hypothetical protein